MGTRPNLSELEKQPVGFDEREHLYIGLLPEN
jgi:hypothetical protein